MCPGLSVWVSIHGFWDKEQIEEKLLQKGGEFQKLSPDLYSAPWKGYVARILDAESSSVPSWASSSSFRFNAEISGGFYGRSFE